MEIKHIDSETFHVLITSDDDNRDIKLPQEMKMVFNKNFVQTFELVETESIRLGEHFLTMNRYCYKLKTNK